tara:strand:+ start:197 stop:1135 length:939 start_codon:yes stop_codon:yes gene_type:complete
MRPIFEKSLLLLPAIAVLPITAFADPNDRRGRHDSSVPERNIEIEYTSVGDSLSSTGDGSVKTSGVLIEAEYEQNNWGFTFGFERWNYQWTKPEALPFINGIGTDPWSSFTTLQLGLEYEQEINDRWELVYYVEAESSYEKQTAGSNEYEVGLDIGYEPSDSWSFVLNTNYEYLDADGGEFGVDLEVTWNDHSKEGWSGELEISSEFPESRLTYHFSNAFSTTLFYNDSGTNTIRLADDSPVTGMQGGYLEDEYQRVGARFAYEWGHEGYLSLSIHKIFNRQMAFLDSTGTIESNFNFEDAVGMSLILSIEL